VWKGRREKGEGEGRKKKKIVRKERGKWGVMQRGQHSVVQSEEGKKELVGWQGKDQKKTHMHRHS